MTRLISVKEAADILGIKGPTVYKLVAAGELAHVRIGTRVLFSPERLDSFVKEHSHEPAQKAERVGA